MALSEMLRKGTYKCIYLTNNCRDAFWTNKNSIFILYSNRLWYNMIANSL
jgi:hypothetical protein